MSARSVPHARSLLRIAALLCLVAVPLLAGAPAQAHPIGNFTLNLYSGIRVGSERVQVAYVLEMAEISTQEQKPGMDLDGDGAISAEERAGWADRAATQIGSNLIMRVNGQPVPLVLEDSSLRFRAGQGGLDLLYMEATFEAPIPTSGAVRYEDRNYEDRPGWREISVAPDPGVALTASSVPERTVSDALRSYPAELANEPLDVRVAEFSYQPSDAPVEPTAPEDGGAAPTSTSPAGSDGFADLLDASSDRAVAVLLLLAFGFGFVHALGPGHGKTIMAASTLSGSVRLRQAISLGGAVALMHCASVIAIGTIALAATRAISSEQVYSGLRVMTAVVILAVGLVLLVVRVRQRRSGDGGHGPGDHHHGHRHEAATASGVDRASIAAVAASGGLLPSPSAIVVLLGAVAVDRIPLGVTLVVTFSLGLATSLVLIGVASHLAKTRIGRTEGWIGSWIPLVSAGAITIVGIILTVGALRAAPGF